MKMFENLEGYNKVAKIGDIISLGGTGLVGFGNLGKSDCYTVTKLGNENNFVSFRPYRSKKTYTTRTNQEVLLIEKKEFNLLPAYGSF